MPEPTPNPPTSGTLSRRGLLRGIGLVGAAGFLGGIQDCTSLEVRQTKIYLPKWDADGFKVVQISDIHVNTGSQLQRALQSVVKALDHKADLIALTGDYLNYLDKITGRHLIEVLGALNSAKCPIVAIFGNHDWLGTPIHEQEAIFTKTKIQLLRNRAVEIDGVTVAGVDDMIACRGDTDFLQQGHFSKSLLGLWHEPDTVLQMPDNVSLQLSGHSHGGEICLPGGIPIHTPGGSKIYTGGFYSRKSVPLYVSKGVATLGPCRLYCPPEISVHTLYSSQGGPARMETIA